MRTLLLLSTAMILVSGCGQEPPPQAPSARNPVVLTTFFPLTWVAQRIGGEDVDVRCPVPPDADPGHWMPPDDVVAQYQQADLILINGAGFEHWVAKVTLPPSRVVDTTAKLQPSFLRYEKAVTHSHGPAGAHVHEGIDGHTWLDPKLLLGQAAEVAEAFKRVAPERASAYSARHLELMREIDALDKAFRAATKGYGGAIVYANHPAYNYVARSYGLRIVNINVDPEAEPTDEVLQEIRAGLARSRSTLMLWEVEPNAELAARLKRDLGLESVVFTPCESPDAAVDGDYLKTMHANVERLRDALAKGR